MKKLLSITLTLVLMLSLCVPAFAEIYVDGESQGSIQEVLVDNAQCVSAGAAGDDLTVIGNVTGDGMHNSVYAEGGGEINVRGTVTGNLSWGGDAIYAKDNSTKVVVGSVQDFGKGGAINASSGVVVIVDATLTENDEGNGINASGNNTNVSVGGNVIETEKGDAIKATDGAEVTVDGNVIESGEGNAIKATGAETMVTVEGNVKEGGTGSAINVTDATVIIVGNVEEANAGDAISALQNATVIVGGNVTDGVETAGASNAVTSGYGATVIVEGLVTGSLNTNGQTDSGTIYLGQLNENGNIKGNADLSKIHYLIGIAPEGSAALSAVTLESDIVAAGTIDGVNEKGYRYTTTADTTALNGKTIILKPADGKILTVSGFDGANVTYVANEDGTVTFTIGDSFIGGLQNLVLVLTDKPASDSEPVYYIVSLGSVTVVEFTAPDGVAEGLIKALESADHAGITVDSSLVGDGSVKVLKGGKELSAKDFSIYTHADGSIDVILSNTYLFALGSGSYDFTAIVNGLEIPFTVVVEK